MILKSYETSKINTDINIILFYGKNDGLKEVSIKEIIKNQTVLNYDQSEIIENQQNFFEEIYSHSFFEKEKTIIIKRASDKIVNIIEKIDLTKIGNTKIILDADNLEKKSKLRSVFEKEKNFVCIAFYPDTVQTLIKLAFNYFKERKISISSSSINLIVNKINGDRKALFNELNKLEIYSKKGKAIDDKIITKIVNLNENYEINELVNSYFAQNQKKVISILNENNFSNEDCIIIIRSFLNKSKKLLNLSNDYLKNQNIEATIASSKPPIFWKEKEIVKQQIYKWKPKDIKNVIYKLNEIELLIKRNINISINIITDFIITQNILKS